MRKTELNADFFSGKGSEVIPNPIPRLHISALHLKQNRNFTSGFAIPKSGILSAED